MSFRRRRSKDSIDDSSDEGLKEFDPQEDTFRQPCPRIKTKNPYQLNSDLFQSIWNNLSQFRLLLIFFSIVLIVISIFVIYCREPVSIDSEVLASEIKTIKHRIKLLFPEQDEKLWTTIFTTIVHGLSRAPSQPVILLLLDRGSNQERKTSNCLVSWIANETSKLMEVDDPDPIHIQGSKFHGESAHFVAKYQSLLIKHGALVLTQLEDLPSSIAEKLHFLCDVVSPLVKKSMYLFTLSVKNSESKATLAAELSLKKIWHGKIKQDSLEPLVARLTDQVAFIKEEKKLPDICSNYFSS